jgi:YD repeat-containing protein
VLRSTTYGTDGQVLESTDPLGRVTRRVYDDLGRLVAEIQNYNAGVNSGLPSGTDDNQTVRYEYTNGLQTKLVADVPSPGTDQETTYSYGTTKGAGATDSKISTGHLLAEVEYPDSTGSSDVVAYAYDAQGRQIAMTDQAGNVIAQTFDAAGRLSARAVATLDAAYDGAVRRIEMGYDSLGRSSTVTQYDAASSGTLVDQVAFTYDAWGNVDSFRGDRNSAVDAMGSVDDYEVSYTHGKATSGRNTLRRTGATLPSGNAITYTYSSTSGLHDDVASRVSSVDDGGVVLSRYRYNGWSQVVQTTYSAVGIQQVVNGSTPGDYSRLDRFNRVTTVQWSNPNNGATVYDVDLTWDRAGNILSIDDQVHSGFDVKVTVDDLDRVTRAHEGTLSAGSIGSPTRDQQWTLDQLGNWDQNRLDLDGNGTFTGTDELDELRSHNEVNEILARDVDGDSSDDYTFTYDATGNLIDDGEDYEFVWDAFGRLRKILDRSDSSLVEEFRYNGLGFLIGEHSDTDIDGDVDGSDLWYYHAYDERWRRLATFRSSDSAPKEEWVPHQAGKDGRGGASYINDVIIRDKDANTAWTTASDGMLEQRGFFCTNWRGDVVAIVGSQGFQVEQVRYSAYGVPFGLPGGDCNSDGDCDAADVTVVDGWIAGPTFDPRGDVDLDGDVDATDRATVVAAYQGKTTGRGVLSGQQNRIGHQGVSAVLSTSELQSDRTVNRLVTLGSLLSRRSSGSGAASMYSRAASCRRGSGVVQSPSSLVNRDASISLDSSSAASRRSSTSPLSGDSRVSGIGSIGELSVGLDALVDDPKTDPEAICAGHCEKTTVKDCEADVESHTSSNCPFGIGIPGFAVDSAASDAICPLLQALVDPPQSCPSVSKGSFFNKKKCKCRDLDKESTEYSWTVPIPDVTITLDTGKANLGPPPQGSSSCSVTISGSITVSYTIEYEFGDCGF